jgi:hypothetical protein
MVPSIDRDIHGSQFLGKPWLGSGESWYVLSLEQCLYTSSMFIYKAGRDRESDSQPVEKRKPKSHLASCALALTRPRSSPPIVFFIDIRRLVPPPSPSSLIKTPRKMKTTNVLSLLTFFAAAFMACVRASNVVTLTTENFDQIIGQGKPALVEFYASWCGHVRIPSHSSDVQC